MKKVLLIMIAMIIAPIYAKCEVDPPKRKIEFKQLEDYKPVAVKRKVYKSQPKRTVSKKQRSKPKCKT